MLLFGLFVLLTFVVVLLKAEKNSASIESWHRQSCQTIKRVNLMDKMGVKTSVSFELLFFIGLRSKLQIKTDKGRKKGIEI